MQLGVFALHTTFFRSPHIGTYAVRYICADRLLRTEPQVFSSNIHINNFMSHMKSSVRMPSKPPSSTARSSSPTTCRPTCIPSSTSGRTAVTPRRRENAAPMAPVGAANAAKARSLNPITIVLSWPSRNNAASTATPSSQFTTPPASWKSSSGQCRSGPLTKSESRLGLEHSQPVRGRSVNLNEIEAFGYCVVL